MYIHEITKRLGVDLSPISNKGKSEKRFNFVIKTNFYSGSGSKLNETERSYKALALESKNINGFDFVWFTGGKGWIRAKNNLEETFYIMEHIYNIKDLENGVINNFLK